MLYQVSGEFSIRRISVVLSGTPFFILLGNNSLFVWRDMGIATASEVFFMLL